jgi:hypothetical protein
MTFYFKKFVWVCTNLISHSEKFKYDSVIVKKKHNDINEKDTRVKDHDKKCSGRYYLILKPKRDISHLGINMLKRKLD